MVAIFRTTGSLVSLLSCCLASSACGATEEKARSPAGGAKRKLACAVLSQSLFGLPRRPQTRQGHGWEQAVTSPPMPWTQQFSVLVCNNRVSSCANRNRTYSRTSQDLSILIYLSASRSIPDPSSPPPTAEKPSNSIFHVLVSEAVDNGVQEGGKDDKSDSNCCVPKYGVGG